jgi:hypothetical protein
MTTTNTKYPNLYYQAGTDKIFVLMDSELRHVPNPATYNNLFIASMTKELVQLESKNLPFNIGQPLMNKAQLVGLPEGVFLTDQLAPSSPITLRHVVNPAQMAAFSFNWDVVIKNYKNPDNYTISNPLTICNLMAATDAAKESIVNI